MTTPFNTTARTAQANGIHGQIARSDSGTPEIHPYKASAETGLGLVVSANATGGINLGGATPIGITTDQVHINGVTSTGNVPANGEASVAHNCYIFLTVPQAVNPTTAVRYSTATGAINAANASTTNVDLEGARWMTVTPIGGTAILRYTS